MTDPDEVLARLEASGGRRALGVGMMTALGALVLYAALVHPPASVGWRVFAILCGGLGLWLGHAMYHATQGAVELTRTGLRTRDGEWIARLSEIVSVDRGAFALKPSNGFLVRLNAKAPARWRPGLWWRVGARVGLGGVTSGGQARAMADILATLLAEDIDREN
ncbi:hypothetical protein [Roseovarius aestuariivivens]|uniref:hypothetical protein n=1 Tax=Roseovarius aestuariivivens TaxID=1888910 RepID=UPI001081C554|nr:hypothetical protein [Roseovarius aestuariivivens]